MPKTTKTEKAEKTSAAATSAPPKPKKTKTKEDKPSSGAVKLRKPQVRILAALAKSADPMNRKEIAESAPCDLAWLNSWVGSTDDAVREKNDLEFPSLVTLKYVKVVRRPSDDGRDRVVDCYEITAAGRRALDKM